MNENNSCLVSVDKRGEVIPADWYKLAEGHLWAYPLLSSARSCLSRVFNYLNNDGSGVNDISNQVNSSRTSVISQFSLTNVSVKMQQRLVFLVTKLERLNKL